MSPHAAKARGIPTPVIVTITRTAHSGSGAKPTVSVSPDPVHVSKGKNEEVVWTCPQNLDFTVIMENGTPFNSSKFTPTVDHSGVPILTPDPGAEVYFKYLVEVGGNVVDPGVIVDA